MVDPLPLYWWIPPADKISAGDSALRQSNFGDAISPFIVETLSGRPVQHSRGNGRLLAVGSIFNFCKPGDVIWGSGMMSNDDWNLPKDHTIDIRAVRGPLTREKLITNGFECPEIYGDPALLMPQLYSATHNPSRKWAIIPHIDSITKHAQWHDRIIDVRWDWKRVIREMMSCEFIISSSLHGIIVAEAYGIPAIWLKTSISRFKFDDYYATTGRKITPVNSLEDALCRPVENSIPAFDTKPLLHAFPYKDDTA